MDGHDAVRLMGIIAELERFAEEEMRCQGSLLRPLPVYAFQNECSLTLTVTKCGTGPWGKGCSSRDISVGRFESDS